MILIIFSLAACRIFAADNSQNGVVEIRVFAASSLNDAFSEIAAEYEIVYPDTKVVLHFASSSQLASQLHERIDADVYASANYQQMESLVNAGLIDPADVVSFAANKLTIIVPAGNPADIHSVEDLGNPGVEFVLAVSGVPIRVYADQVIRMLDIDDQQAIYGNRVSEEVNVRQVVSKVVLGEADAAIVYTSDVTPDIRERIEVIDIAPSMNVQASYPIAVLKEGDHPETAESLIDFVLSDRGQTILSFWGFEMGNSIEGGAAE